MLNRTSTRSAGLAAAMLASLVIVPVAVAMPDGQAVSPAPSVGRQLPPDRTDKIGVITHSPVVAAPDRVDKVGVILPGGIGVPDRIDGLGVVNAGPVGAPDRADQLGTVNGPGPVAVATVPSPSSGSSVLKDAPLLAAALFALALLGTIVALVSRRRGGPAALAS
jgi:hypothetical protein